MHTTADLAQTLHLLSHLGRLGLRGSEQGLLRTLLLEATPVQAEQTEDEQLWALPAQPHDLDHRWSWAKLGTVAGYCKRAMQYAGARLVELGLLVKDGAVDPQRAWCPNRYLLRVEVLEEQAAAALVREREQRLERVRGFGGGEPVPSKASSTTSRSSSPSPSAPPPPTPTTTRQQLVPEGPEPECVDWARAEARALLASRGMPIWVARLTEEQGEDLAEIALAFAAMVSRHRGPSWWWETAGSWAAPLKVLWLAAARPDGRWVQRLALVLAAWRAGRLDRVVRDRGGARAKVADLNGVLRPRNFRLALERAAAWWQEYEVSVERERYQQVAAAVQDRLGHVLQPAWRALEGSDRPSTSPAPQLWLGWRSLMEAQLQQLQPQDLEQRVLADLLGDLLDASQQLGRTPALELLRAMLIAGQALASELGLEAAARPPPGLAPPTQGPPAR